MRFVLRSHGLLRVVLVFVALIVAALLPVVASGYSDMARAEGARQNKDYVSAAQYYGSASLKLPWKPELLEDAAIAMSHVDADAAIALFERVRARGGLSANGWDVYGATYWTTGRYEPALEVWQVGLQQYPSHHEFYWLLHLAHRQLGDFAAEQTWLEKWLATSKGRAFDHYELGLLLMTSDPARARTEFAIATSMDSSFDSAIRTLEATLDAAAHETEDSRRLVILGRGIGLVNEWPLAQSVFEQAKSANKQNPEAWAWLGEAHQENGLDGKPELDEALMLDPNDTLVRALRALYWKRQGQYEAEIAEYSKAAQIEPDNAEWQSGLGGAYSATGDLVSALASYQKATSLEGENATYWRLLAAFCADNAVHVADIGLPAARRAADLAPKDPQVLDALGWSFAQAGLLYNAEQALVKATQIAPDLALAHLHLAETYLRKGDQASAVRELKLVRQLDADGPAGEFAQRLLDQYFP